VLEVGHGKFAFTYAYDAGGNRTAVTDRSGSHAYQYDELNRLTGAKHENAPAESYAYDAAGNRESSATDPAYRYDAAGRLVAAEGAIFAYDKNGNLTSKTTAGGKATYTWDIENRLVRVDLPDGGTVAYRYDPFGRRIEKNVNGTVTAYLYDGNAILMEMDASGQTTARYTHGPGIDWPLLVEREGQTFFYHADALGSVTGLTDASGNVSKSYAYDSWGRPQGLEGSAPVNPFLFAGREYDAETGLYYLRARYYDPGVGRFLSADPLDLPAMLVAGQSPSHEEALLPPAAAAALRGGTLGQISALRAAAQRTPQTLNAYAYAVNNPIRLSDPAGLQTCQVSPGAGSALAGVSAGGEVQPGANQEFDKGKFKAKVDVGAALGIGAGVKVNVDVNVGTTPPSSGSAAGESTGGPNIPPKVSAIVKGLW
jgi:RHS repeat-associated protein